MFKTILFTHDDLDGAGCRIIFQLAHEDLQKGIDYEVYNCSNFNVDEIVKSVIRSDSVDENTRICFGDIVASRDILEEIAAKFKNVNIWDHHRTNFFAEHIISNATIIPENTFGQLQSGTSIMYQYFSDVGSKDKTLKCFKDSYQWSFLLSKFVDCIRSYDTYEWKETNNIEAKKLQTLFILLGMENFCKRYIDKFLSAYTHDAGLISINDLDFVNAKLEREQSIIDKFDIIDIHIIDLYGLKIGLLCKDMMVNISELSYQFLSKYPDIDVLATFSLADEGAWQFRTVKDDIDIGKIIAAPIGGGGHPKAAGAPLPQGFKDLLLELLKFYLNPDDHRNIYIE